MVVAGELERAYELERASYDVAHAAGEVVGLRWAEGNLVKSLYWRGEWDEAVRLAEPSSHRPSPARCTTWPARGTTSAAGSASRGASRAPSRTWSGRSSSQRPPRTPRSSIRLGSSPATSSWRPARRSGRESFFRNPKTGRRADCSPFRLRRARVAGVRSRCGEESPPRARRDSARRPGRGRPGDPIRRTAPRRRHLRPHGRQARSGLHAHALRGAGGGGARARLLPLGRRLALRPRVRAAARGYGLSLSRSRRCGTIVAAAKDARTATTPAAAAIRNARRRPRR